MWTLTLYGPGTLNVSKFDPTTNTVTPFPANHPDTPTVTGTIDTITVAGTDTLHSKLVGKLVKKGATGDGRIFFENLKVIGGGALTKLDPLSTMNSNSPNNGINTIDMPNFWLGHTQTTTPQGGAAAGSITAPDGVVTLRFGGVDADFTPTGGTALNTNNQSDHFDVFLGLPSFAGTSIIVDRVVTDAQQTASTTAGQPPTTTQDSVNVIVSGRLNLFQANAIQGNTALPPTQFADHDLAAGTPQLAGGTFVISEAASGASGSVTGQIGDVRVGGNATNFTTFALEGPVGNTQSDPSPDAKVSNFSIGGETNNVILLAPGGSRNIYFGKGMDTVKINSLVISTLQANRGALNSDVTVTRGIGSMEFGGDVVNTNVQSGYAQGIGSIATSSRSSFAPGMGVFEGRPVTTIANRTPDARGTFSPQAQNGGQIKVHVAGDVINSVFSASIEPNPAELVTQNPNPTSTDPTANQNTAKFGEPFSPVFAFGDPRNIVFPRGVIEAKVEGKIDNSKNILVDQNQDSASKTAFFAKTVRLDHGPVVPPTVPEAPYPGPTVYHRGQFGLKSLLPIDHNSPTSTTTQPTTTPTTHGGNPANLPTPKGPVHTAKKPRGK